MANRGIWYKYGDEIKMLRQQGHTLQFIADKFGVTKERIRQLLVEHCGSLQQKHISRDKLAQELRCSAVTLTDFEQKGKLHPQHHGKLYLYGEAESRRAKELLEQCRKTKAERFKERRVERICPTCGRLFSVMKSQISSLSPHKFCSRGCIRTVGFHIRTREGGRVERVCLTCGKHFSVQKSTIGPLAPRKFCSRSCVRVVGFNA